MKIYVYGYGTAEKVPEIIILCAEEVLKMGHGIVCNLADADIAIAPLLQTKIPDKDIDKPRLGTLIFHPSLLPRHRGRDAIRWAYHLGETYTGATWFWADSGYDTGEICEQEVIAIGNKRPRDFYEHDVIPVAVRLLRYILLDLKIGIVRRRPQNEASASHEPPFVKQSSTPSA